MRYLLVPVIYFALCVNLFAIGVDKNRLEDPVLEKKAHMIMTQLRCLVCQNQSIVESDADLAKDLRLIVRELVKDGKSKEEVLAFMTSRYGDWVLLQPPFKLGTIILWLGPLFLLLIGGFFVFRFVRGRPETAIAAPLSDAEEKRLKNIMQEGRK